NNNHFSATFLRVKCLIVSVPLHYPTRPYMVYRSTTDHPARAGWGAIPQDAQETSSSFTKRSGTNR
ncbi:MAG: hypothetical protein Q4A71_07495, partial [Actinomycetaceae bacterium]|nr:hypothetical protein [Actinomycetaceae bacterium]